MTSMIRGTDMKFPAPKRGFDLLPVLDAILEVWPDGLVQGADEDDVFRLPDLLKAQGVASWRECFVYKDRLAADSWEKDGWTEAHGNDMVHVLVQDDPAQPEAIQITLVVDEMTGEMIRLLAAVVDALPEMAAGERGPGGLGRVDWEAALRALGYASGRDQFYDKVEELRSALFPTYTADELACNPSVARQFCDVVRGAVGVPVPDHLVMKALMNRRRQRRKDSAVPGPRVV